MNDLTQKLTEDLVPVLAITVYKGNESNRFYLESHDVNEQGQVLAGKPLEQDTIQGIVDVLFDERMNKADITGMVPSNLLAFQINPGGKYKMMWYRSPEKRVIHHAAQLKIPTGIAWVPAMIYLVDKNDLSVYALKSTGRPTEKTRLCYAPFFNVDDEGSVCLGNAKVKPPKEKTFDNIIQYWEDLFWLSEFSHVNGKEKVKSKNLASVWCKLISSKGRKKWEDVNELVQSTQTIKDIL